MAGSFLDPSPFPLKRKGLWAFHAGCQRNTAFNLQPADRNQLKTLDDPICVYPQMRAAIAMSVPKPHPHAGSAVLRRFGQFVRISGLGTVTALSVCRYTLATLIAGSFCQMGRPTSYLIA